MSGNSVAPGAYLGEGRWAEAARRLTPIPLFVCRIVLGAVLIEVPARRGVRSSFALAMGLESLLLLGYWAYETSAYRDGTMHVGAAWHFDLVVALRAVALGLQNAALQRVGGKSVHTTYVTGMLTSLATEGTTYLFWLEDGKRANAKVVGGVVAREPSLGRTILLVAIYGAYLVGAIVGGFTLLRWALGTLALPLAALAALIAVGLARPIYAPTTPR